MADLYKSSSDVYAYPNTQSGRTPAQPARIPLAVTPSDTQDLPNSSNTGVYAKALYIGGSGDVAVIGVGDQSAGGAGTSVVFKAHPVGYMPVQVRRVLSTGTTATNIIALMD